VTRRRHPKAGQQGKNRKPKLGKPWGEWEERDVNVPHDDRNGRTLADIGFTRAVINFRYVVLFQTVPTGLWGPVLHLHIRSTTASKVVPWAHRQRIKNELVGQNARSIEINPPTQELVDSADAYHLWVLPTATPWPPELGRALRETWDEVQPTVKALIAKEGWRVLGSPSMAYGREAIEKMAERAQERGEIVEVKEDANGKLEAWVTQSRYP